MKAVFSFWTRPLAVRFGKYGEFARARRFLQSWAMSVRLAARHYDHIELITDTPGRALLQDALGLPFTSVSTVLDDVPEHVPTFHWALSKLVAYSLQKEPFVHIDSDVYLWKRLPERMERAPLFAQNRESDVWSVHYYQDAYRAIVQHLAWLPPSFAETESTRGHAPHAVNAGILGGQDVAFLNDYALQALELVLHPDNQPGWRKVEETRAGNSRFPVTAVPVVVEQYLFHRAALQAGKWEQVEFLIDERTAFEQVDRSAQACRELGYTHLMSPQAKHDDSIAQRLARRLEVEFPDTAARVDAFDSIYRDDPLLGRFCEVKDESLKG